MYVTYPRSLIEIMYKQFVFKGQRKVSKPNYCSLVTQRTMIRWMKMTIRRR